MDKVLYPDGHTTEVVAGLTLEDMAEDRFLYQPLTWYRYKDSGRLKLMLNGTPPTAPTFAEAERVLRLTDLEHGSVPRDWENPEWESAGKVHEWKNYVSGRVRLLWQTFTLEQKQALALQADSQASNEHWD